MRPLPAGTVTFVFSDIEGSTSHFHRLGDRYAAELEAHNRLVGRALDEQGGVIVKTEGDSFFAAFDDARSAVRACVEAQRALAAFAWPSGVPLSVRMGVHTGQAEPVEGDYVALAVNRASRVSAAGHGDQILVSPTTAAIAADPDWGFERLGEYRLRGFPAAIVLYQVAARGLRAEFPPLRAPGVVNHNLPALPSPLIGRDEELETVRRLLARERLVTLAGPGGVGKTSLVILAAEGVAPRFPGGAWWVDLAVVKSADLVAEAIGAVLGVLEGGGLVDARIEDRLIGQPTLLLLNNCDHLTDAVAVLLDRLLERCPELTVAATSREALGQRRETVFELGTLDTADGASLLVERAMQAGWTGPAGEEDAGALAEIARYLGGLPLALELVGARLSDRAPVQILGELRRAGPSGDSALLAPAMRASLTWSYDLLDEDTAGCFRRLAAFAGAGTLEAAANVCAAEGQSPGRVAEMLLSLADRSLVQIRLTAGRRRVHIFETIRGFAAELLAQEKDEGAFDRHLAWYLALAEGAKAVLDYGPERRREGERLATEVEDLRAALGRATAKGDVVVALTIGRVAAAVCTVGSRTAEARECYADALSAASKLHPDYARAAADLASLLYLAGDARAAERWAAEACELAAGSGAIHAEALALTNLARLTAARGDLDRAEQILEDALERATTVGGHPMIVALLAEGLFAERRGDFRHQAEANEKAVARARQLGDPRVLALALANLATARTNLEDLDASEMLLREAVELSDADATSFSRHYAFINLGYLAFRRGNLEEAHRLNARAADESRAAGRTKELANAVNNVAEVAFAAGDHEGALRAYTEALRLGAKVEDAERVCYCLEGIAAIASARRDPRRAVELLAFAEIQRGTAQLSLPDSYRQSNEALIVRARAELGSARFAEAWRSGTELDLQDAIQRATNMGPP